MDSEIFQEFKVLSKQWGHPRPVTRNYITAGIKELMLALKEDGIIPEQVEFLYIHQHIKTERGIEVIEHRAVDNTVIGTDKQITVPEEPKVVKSNVVPITSSRKHRRDKPRIRLKNPPEEVDHKWVKQGLYSAAQV